MQKVKIDIYISDLLYRYDCVIVPDFGGFVANYASAKMQPIQHKFQPPSKKISFNKNLRQNDGLLSNHIAERRSIPYEEANALIRSFVSQSMEGLKNGDKAVIEKVGTFYLDAERNIQFKADEQNDFFLDSFGLSSFRAIPIEREKAEERIQKQVREELPKLHSVETAKSKRYWLAAAALLFIMASGFLLNRQFDWVDHSKIEYTFINVLDTATPHYSGKTIRRKAISLELFPDALQPIDLEEGIVPFVTSNGEKTPIYIDNRSEGYSPEADNTKVDKSNLNNSMKFHVVGGCFSQKSNATALVKKLQRLGFDSRLLGTYKKLHAVSFGSFSSREEAVKMLADVRNGENPDAWLLVKPF